MELAAKNALLVLSQDKEKIKRRRASDHRSHEPGGRAGWGFQKVKRIEAYDISNISGFESVGSMVVYEDGRPKRNDYRKFKITNGPGAQRLCLHGGGAHATVCPRSGRAGRAYGMETADGDPGNMEGSGASPRFPDLIMMDGGRGQVNIALEVLERLGLSIPVCGMVKDDNHRTRGLYYKNVEIPIDRYSEGFKLITRIQDEAHRFAIEYHRSLRSRARSALSWMISRGIGPARRKALMRHV